MHLIIERMITDFECGRVTRRQLTASLAALVTGTQAATKPLASNWIARVAILL